VALGVIMAAHGYPAAPRKGDVITGLPRAHGRNPTCRSSMPARSAEDGKTLTSGGRVLCVTAMGRFGAPGAAACAGSVRQIQL
jgi:phosphoribosylamine--glycine ligase